MSKGELQVRCPKVGFESDVQAWASSEVTRVDKC
jgi:hypothetical protein